VVEPPTSLKKYEFVSWDYDIPNIWRKKKSSHVPNHQPEKINGLVGLYTVMDIGLYSWNIWIWPKNMATFYLKYTNIDKI